MKPYLTYKDSGIEWIGKIPAHWETLPLKYATIIDQAGAGLGRGERSGVQVKM